MYICVDCLYKHCSMIDLDTTFSVELEEVCEVCEEHHHVVLDISTHAFRIAALLRESLKQE